MDKIIKIQNLHYTYPEDEIETLRGLNLEIERGSFVAVLGHNGSGKSTLAKLLNALLLPTEGKVFIDGMDSSDESLTLEIRRTVGLVFQNPDNQLVANLVEDDVAFAPENLGIPADEIRSASTRLLKRLACRISNCTLRTCFQADKSRELQLPAYLPCCLAV